MSVMQGMDANGANLGGNVVSSSASSYNYSSHSKKTVINNNSAIQSEEKATKRFVLSLEVTQKFQGSRCSLGPDSDSRNTNFMLYV